MNEDVRAEDGGQVADADAVLPLPLEFEALYVATQEAFHDYALFYLGANDAAEEAVHRAFLEILNHWSALLEESNLQQQAWAILRRVVISQALRNSEGSSPCCAATSACSRRCPACRRASSTSSSCGMS